VLQVNTVARITVAVVLALVASVSAKVALGTCFSKTCIERDNTHLIAILNALAIDMEAESALDSLAKSGLLRENRFEILRGENRVAWAISGPLHYFFSTMTWRVTLNVKHGILVGAGVRVLEHGYLVCGAPKDRGITVSYPNLDCLAN
jgi:hypothetical protein